MATHRYWRVRITQTWGGSGGALGTVEMRTAQDGSGSNLSTTGNGTASASSTFSGSYLPSYAFDGSGPATYWFSNSEVPCWLKWDFGAGNEKDIMHLVLVNPGSTNSASPRNAVLQYSDNDTDWTNWIIANGNTSGASASFSYPWVPPVIGEVDALLFLPVVSLLVGGGTTDAEMPIITADANGAAVVDASMPGLIGDAGLSPIVDAGLPMLVADIAGVSGVLNTVDALLPLLQIQAATGAAADSTLPALHSEIAGTTTILVAVDALLPMPAPDIAGTSPSMGRVEAAIPMLTANVGGAGWLFGILPAVTADISATTGAVGSVTAELPMLESEIVVSRAATVTVDALLPALTIGAVFELDARLPILVADIEGRLVVAVVYEAYAINLQPSAGYRESAVHEVTRYTGMPFDQIIRYQGRHYGIADTGIYLLGGETDASVPIPWAWRTAVTNFSSRQQSVVREGFLNGRLGPSVKATVSIGEQAEVTYPAVLERGRAGQAHRIKYGRGLKAQYWSFGLESAAGGPCDIDSMLHEPQPISRKV